MRSLLLIAVLAGCAAGRATFTIDDGGVTRTEKQSYPDAELETRDDGWKVRLWGPDGSSVFDPLGGLFANRDYIDIRLPKALHEGLVVDLEEFGHALEAGTVRPFARNPYVEYKRGKVVIKGWDPGLKRVRGTFEAEAEGRKIEGSFTASPED